MQFNSAVYPANHQSDLAGKVDIRNAQYIVIDWSWMINNPNRNMPTWAAFCVEFAHDVGGIFGARDETFFEIIPGTGVVFATDSGRAREFKKFAEGQVGGSNLYVEVPPEWKGLYPAGFWIPGPMNSTEAREWREKNRDAKFHLNLTLYSMPGPNSRLESAAKVVEHRWERIFEIDGRGW